MEAEAAPLVEHLQLKRTPGLLGAVPLTCDCFTGSAHGMSVTVVTSGKCWRYGVDSVGTVPAALAAYAVLTTLKPDLLLNAGTAGGFRSRGGSIGDVYVATAARHHDRRIEMPVFDEYGIWHVDCTTGKKMAEVWASICTLVPHSLIPLFLLCTRHWTSSWAL
jgi:5'-methylthioadenosine nucleosidase